MKDLIRTNCFDVPEDMIIVGSCFPAMQPKAFEELKSNSNDIFEVCLEEIHLNMVITKIIGMLRRGKIKKITFATVDKSPHCIQLHYIENEIKKVINIKDIEFVHYVAVDNKLVKVSNETIKKSRCLSELE